MEDINLQGCRAFVASILNQAIKDCATFNRPRHLHIIEHLRETTPRKKYQRKLSINDEEYLAAEARYWINEKEKEFDYYCGLINVDSDALREKINKCLVYYDFGLANEITKHFNPIQKSINLLSIYLINVLHFLYEYACKSIKNDKYYPIERLGA